MQGPSKKGGNMTTDKREGDIHTQGGAIVGGDVTTGGDFVSRDKLEVHITFQAAPFDLSAELAACGGARSHQQNCPTKWP
jgi:hypothetical protein